MHWIHKDIWEHFITWTVGWELWIISCCSQCKHRFKPERKRSPCLCTLGVPSLPSPAESPSLSSVDQNSTVKLISNTPIPTIWKAQCTNNTWTQLLMGLSLHSLKTGQINQPVWLGRPWLGQSWPSRWMLSEWCLFCPVWTFAERHSHTWHSNAYTT